MKTKILIGDVCAVLKRQPAESFDAVLSDPPYGLEFMGKDWDGVVPGPEVWREVLRVLKPGAPMLVFGGARTFHRLACAIEDAGFQLADTICWLHGQGFPKGHSQLKPAWEPVTLAWKKKGGSRRVLAIDAGRIGSEGGNRYVGRRADASAKSVNTFGNGLNAKQCRVVPGLGRWPANVILDQEAAAELDRQSGTLTSGNNPAKRSSDKHRNVYAGWTGAQCLVRRGTDSGGASRFFYCAKASTKERGEGNMHPTVKPLKLTEYLARLILPPKRDALRRILIPFMGSGSEMLGARKAGWDYALGIENNEEYAEIAAKRLAATA